ncbi:hypothetical protein H4P12_07210 [Paracoccus sp. 11-3]|uniref:Uncharacterized protein n=1 Tax=Paracoccus amoyensis TaxID=2760093 RepID=A0A926JD43_9RHOB|nr:hypothetical protein [Paracoccus amoyensis]MBC9246503.1 hypothetical protein [Paracoccus amoyensis]
MSKRDFEEPLGSSARLREFVRQERESGVHPSVMALRSRPKDRSEDGRKVSEFARIERGHEV